MANVRLRQVALVARDLDPVAARLESDLGLPEPFPDPGIGKFGLRNAVYAVGDTFLEVVAPVQDDTTAGRYLDRRGGDAGYMAIFQFADFAALDAVRQRLPRLGVRVVWQDDGHDDIRGTHVHPRDVPGAIVSLDAANPPESWHWAGPDWTGGAPASYEPGGITGITVAAVDPDAVAAKWAAVLGVAADGRRVTLDGRRQVIDFVPAADRTAEGITTVAFDRPGREGTYEICGVRMDVRADGER